MISVVTLSHSTIGKRNGGDQSLQYDTIR